MFSSKLTIITTLSLFWAVVVVVIVVAVIPVTEVFDYAFMENGLTAYKLGRPLASQSFIQFVGEERYKKLANFILHYIADLDIPVKRSVWPPSLRPLFLSRLLS